VEDESRQRDEPERPEERPEDRPGGQPEDRPEEPGAEGGSISPAADRLPGAPADDDSPLGDTDQHSSG
jgi:hypothetical protein